MPVNKQTGTKSQPVGKAVSSKSVGVRAFREGDFPQVVYFINKMFPRSPKSTLRVKEDILSELLLNNPWDDERYPSLVFENRDGRIIGFLGVAPRKMVIKDRPIDVAISYNFAVDPDSRSSMAGISLVKAFLEGPQDLSFADSANNTSRRLWERMNGMTVPSYSIYWKHPLRPSEFVAYHLRKRNRMKFLARAATPLCRFTDTIINKYWDGTKVHEDTDSYRIREVSVDELKQYIEQLSKGKSLRPVYTKENLSWLMNVAGKPRRFGQLQKEVVFDQHNKMAGWFIYYKNPGGESEVLQMQALPEKRVQVFSMLLQKVRQQGAIDITGRLDPEWVAVIPNTAYCWYMPGRVWMIAHSRDKEILQAFKAGDAFITRLEGDMWLL
jgi:hypothetical protein